MKEQKTKKQTNKKRQEYFKLKLSHCQSGIAAE